VDVFRAPLLMFEMIYTDV